MVNKKFRAVKSLKDQTYYTDERVVENNATTTIEMIGSGETHDIEYAGYEITYSNNPLFSHMVLVDGLLLDLSKETWDGFEDFLEKAIEVYLAAENSVQKV